MAPRKAEDRALAIAWDIGGPRAAPAAIEHMARQIKPVLQARGSIPETEAALRDLLTYLGVMARQEVDA